MKAFIDGLSIFRSERKKLAVELEKLKQRREFLMTAPPPVEDLIELFSSSPDQKTVWAFQQKAKELGEKINRIRYWADSEKLQEQRNLQRFRLSFLSEPFVSLYADPNSVRSLPVDPGIFTALFKDLLVERLTEMLKTIDFGDVGPPLANRPKELSKIDKRIAQVRKELEKFDQLQKQAGVSVRDDSYRHPDAKQ
ncbi:MAG: hypothetical protein AAAFM81_11070 [Pseudomonadota bacterium]